VSAAVRAAIAAAATTVTGIKVEPYFTPVTKPGAGCVRLDRTDYPNRLGGVDFWQVIVRLPQDLAEAEKYMDANRLLLYEAVSAEIVVTAIAPQQVIFDEGTPALPCLIITGHRAQEE
jgi:hypothetical protein